MRLREKLDALTKAFAEDVARAVRSAPLGEIARITGRALPEPVKAAAAAKTPRAPKAPKLPRTVASETKTPPQLDGALVDAAVEFFTERGDRGATASQLGDHLDVERHGHAGVVVDLVRVLAERAIIRDAGIRRATGKGTAPVFVLDRSATAARAEG